MALTLLYITNRPEVAEIAQRAGVDRIWVDMEYMGKEERQAGMNTVKSHHTIQDIKNIRKVVNTSELLVRINPIHDETREYGSSENEIEDTIQAGADVIMLPMFKTATDVQRFFNAVKGRTKTILLFETAEAVENIDEILALPGVDEVHIGLNDLHLAYKKNFMFELLTDGTVEKLVNKFKGKGIKFGFGGIARIGYGDLPAEYILTEHYRLGSSMAILSRNFCNADRTPNIDMIQDVFIDGVREIREREKHICGYLAEQFDANHLEVIKRVNNIVDKKKMEN